MKNKELKRLLKLYFHYLDGKEIIKDHKFIGDSISINPPAYQFKCKKCNKILFFNSFNYITYEDQFLLGAIRINKEYPLSCSEEIIKSIIE
jgi:hypothetical protein